MQLKKKLSKTLSKAKIANSFLVTVLLKNYQSFNL